MVFWILLLGLLSQNGLFLFLWSLFSESSPSDFRFVFAGKVPLSKALAPLLASPARVSYAEPKGELRISNRKHSAVLPGFSGVLEPGKGDFPAEVSLEKTRKPLTARRVPLPPSEKLRRTLRATYGVMAFIFEGEVGGSRVILGVGGARLMVFRIKKNAKIWALPLDCPPPINSLSKCRRHSNCLGVRLLKAGTGPQILFVPGAGIVFFHKGKAPLTFVLPPLPVFPGPSLQLQLLNNRVFITAAKYSQGTLYIEGFSLKFDLKRRTCIQTNLRVPLNTSTPQQLNPSTCHLLDPLTCLAFGPSTPQPLNPSPPTLHQYKFFSHKQRISLCLFFLRGSIDCFAELPPQRAGDSLDQLVDSIALLSMGLLFTAVVARSAGLLFFSKKAKKT